MGQAVLPSCPFPPIPWFVFANGNEVKINWLEHYPKQTWRNRYAIASSHGMEILTIPIEGQKGKKTAFRDIRIFGTDWKRRHLQSINTAYGKSAYFLHIEEDLRKIFEVEKHDFLIDFNNSTLELTKRFFPEIIVSNCEEFVETNNSIWEPSFVWPEFPAYTQVFSDRQPFLRALSSLDLLLNRGKRSVDYILLLKNGGQLSSMNE
ncbi:MAG: WbqC family protein [Flavobacteriales bacterium]|nr:WbqC family protein [Flavobacteriales bacterium]